MPDWDHFFASLRKYLDYFRAHIQVIPTINGFVGELQSISDGELAGLLSWTKLATAISLKDPDSRRQFCQDKGWNVIESSVGLLASPVPLVFKGCLCNFLAALAIDEMAAVNIWNCLLCECICAKQIGGKSVGIQQDLDSREANLKIYDYSQGFLTLMKELLSHKARPSTQQIAPFIHFIVNSILCQFSTRSYSNITQMWTLVKLALDCLYQPLKTFFVTAVTVDNKVFEVQILCQLLSDSQLSRALLQIIAEGGSQLQDNKLFSHFQAREDATCSAIRLLYIAISNRSALSDAIRAVNCDILIASIESILFSPFPYSQQRIDNNYMSLLFHYINEIDSFVKHAFFVWLIIKEATAQRPSLQSHIVQSLLPRRQKLINCVATLSIFSLEDIFVGINDLALIDIEGIPYGRLKGEVCRLMLEVFNDAIQYNCNSPNITFALMNFDLMNIFATMLDLPGQGSTCLHNILDIVLQLADSSSPFSTQFSGLYEPALRLILRLCSLGSSSSSIVLRFLRSHYDLIYRLAQSTVFKNSLSQINSNDVTPSESFENESFYWRRENDEYALVTIQRSLQSIILELIALDLSSLLRSGLIEHPHKYLRLLFSASSDQNSQSSNLFSSSNIEGQNVLFWSLLESSRVFVGDLSPPICNKFDPNKMEELLSLCIRKNSCNIEQFDVVYLQLLLNSEINCIMNTEIDVIREEARSILNFCVKKNALNLLEGSCTHLLEGWLSVMNVLSVHVPLPFINISTHKHILVDALFLLRDYCRSVEMSSELADRKSVV